MTKDQSPGISVGFHTDNKALDRQELAFRRRRYPNNPIVCQEKFHPTGGLATYRLFSNILSEADFAGFDPVSCTILPDYGMDTPDYIIASGRKVPISPFRILH